MFPGTEGGGDSLGSFQDTCMVRIRQVEFNWHNDLPSKPGVPGQGNSEPVWPSG